MPIDRIFVFNLIFKGCLIFSDEAKEMLATYVMCN